MIKSLVERMRLPRLGVIRLGIKRTNAAGKEYPAEVEYFVVPDDLRSVLDAKPVKIPVLFPSDDPDRVLVADYVRYSGKLCTLKCDGETFHEFPVSGPERTGPCQKPDLRTPCPCKATAKARLNVIVLDGPLGVYQVLIGGEQRIADLYSELAVFKQTLGRLTNVLFWIERIPTEVQVRREDGTRLPKTGWPVHVRCDFTAKQALRFRQLDVLGAGEPVAALPPGPIEESETEAVPDEPGELVPTGGDSAKAAGTSAASGDDQDSARRAESPPAEIVTPLDAPAEEWTVERVVGRATYLGVGPGTFRDYVALRFRGLVLDDLGARELQTLGQEMTAAESGGLKAKADWKLQLLTALKEAAQAKRRPVGAGR